MCTRQPDKAYLSYTSYTSNLKSIGAIGSIDPFPKQSMR